MQSAPMHCQYAMDDIIAQTGVPGAKAFFDDVTIPGRREDWRELWGHTVKVLRALTRAGLMINLKKCKFLAPSAVVLGYQLVEGGYSIAKKFLKKWHTLQVPASIKDLQKLLGKFLWCSHFVPRFKELVAPLEALLSPKGGGCWTEACTEAANRLVQVIFSQIQLHQADPYGVLHLYPSFGD